MIHSYKDLIVWQKSMDLVCIIYELTEHFPPGEIHGLTSQMRKSAVSIPSNIAEGRRRGSKKDFKRFLQYAYASGGELETQIEIAKRTAIGGVVNFTQAEMLLDEVMRMLNSMMMKLKNFPNQLIS